MPFRTLEEFKYIALSFKRFSTLAYNSALTFIYKDEFKKLSEDERGAIGSENQKFLRDFDTEAAQMEFHHLPQKPSRMEFHLVIVVRH